MKFYHCFCSVFGVKLESVAKSCEEVATQMYDGPRVVEAAYQ